MIRNNLIDNEFIDLGKRKKRVINVQNNK